MFDRYRLRLPVFAGPLDVLLRLIEREQLPISDVSLMAVFDQFMDHMRALDAPKPELLAEFAAVSGRLSVLKSRSLLPKPQPVEADGDELDLVSQLEAYRALKAVSHHLAELQHRGAGAFARGEGIVRPDLERARPFPQPPSALARAMKRWASRMVLPPLIVVRERVVSLPEMISRIATILLGQGTLTFDRVRQGCASRQEVAVAFVAVLTLVRRQAVRVNQGEVFGPIAIERLVLTTPVKSADSLPQGANGIHLSD